MKSSGIVEQPESVAFVCARLEDFFDVNAQWHRRPWDYGFVLGLRELSAAVEWVEYKSLSTGTLKWLSRDPERLQGPDQGVGDKIVK